eukprot:GHRR01036792.1.p1 GENE.GHRR01036792.1~~GHRR01036792.1.p1  ORF type:complete len:128 (+),score=18.87 GHRR01036792.1:366-749(+)
MQELLLLLDEYWSKHPQLQGIPIYQASGVARKALNVFQTYVGMMNADIQKAFQVRLRCSVWCAVIVCASTVSGMRAYSPGCWTSLAWLNIDSIDSNRRSGLNLHLAVYTHTMLQGYSLQGATLLAMA